MYFKSVGLRFEFVTQSQLVQKFKLKMQNSVTVFTRMDITPTKVNQFG